MLLWAVLPTFSQDVNPLIGKGNEAYRLKQYEKAQAAYREALKIDPDNAIALFNLGNALFKDGKYDEAVNSYNTASKHIGDPKLQSQLYYNKGVAFTRQNKLDESIAAYKQSLRVDASDTLARENLQRALNEKQQQDQQNEDRNRQAMQNPPPRPGKLTPQQVEELLKALEEQEQKLQDKKLKKAQTTGQPAKDW